MKKGFLLLASKTEFHRRGAVLGSLLVLAAFVAVGAVLWAKAQPIPDQQQLQPEETAEQAEAPPEEAQPLDPVLVRQLSRLAILDPINFEKEMAKYKTPEDLEKEAIEQLAIVNPAEYSRLFDPPADEARQRYVAASMMAITNPAAYNAEIEKLKTPEQKQADAAALEAMLHPQPAPRLAPEPEFVTP